MHANSKFIKEKKILFFYVLRYTHAFAIKYTFGIVHFVIVIIPLVHWRLNKLSTI